ncbi:hypothetical protein [Azospirillum sp. TSO5]|uniref:hypothetical protein n=1 Tax=Azospirillum sp. TSO5 TaxID=716760 RepID=UPI0011B1FB6D|nr:hypothetical protein [Azospirillum sp. TSO5]
MEETMCKLYVIDPSSPAGHDHQVFDSQAQAEECAITLSNSKGGERIYVCGEPFVDQSNFRRTAYKVISISGIPRSASRKSRKGGSAAVLQAPTGAQKIVETEPSRWEPLGSHVVEYVVGA